MTQDTEIALIEFKGTTLPALAITLRSLDPQALATASSALFGEGGFFDNDLAVLDLGQLAIWPDRIDWQVITDLLTSHGLKVLGVTRGHSELAASALAAGLPTLTLSAGRMGKPSPAAKADAESDAVMPNPERDNIPAGLRKSQPVPTEVIADGNIHVYAPLRGRALAGARGNAEARILTTVFAAELVSIAGIYRTFDEGVPAKLANQPVQVRLATEPVVSSNTGLKSRLEIDILRVD